MHRDSWFSVVIECGCSTVNFARPDIEHSVLVRRQPAELRAVGRNLWITPLRISKKDFPRNKRGSSAWAEAANSSSSSSKSLFIPARLPKCSYWPNGFTI